MNAPIALFVYNRPDHTRRTIDALQKNELAAESDLYIFADGEKSGIGDAEVERIKKVREIISHVGGFKKVVVKVADKNLGLEKSIVTGINYVLENNSSIIVLEDDIVTSNFFLAFCNQGLDKYKDDENVAAISGYMFPIHTNTTEAFFLPTISCWGWATWKRSWKLFNGDASQHLEAIRKNGLESKFNLNNSYPYMNMLEMKAAGKINSWAVCWYASIFLNGGLMAYPSVSLVENTGMDGSGTNFVNRNWDHQLKIASLASINLNLPKVVIENKFMQRKVEKFLRRIHYPNLRERIISRVKRLIQKHS